MTKNSILLILLIITLPISGFSDTSMEFNSQHYRPAPPGLSVQNPATVSLTRGIYIEYFYGQSSVRADYMEPSNNEKTFNHISVPFFFDTRIGITNVSKVLLEKYDTYSYLDSNNTPLYHTFTNQSYHKYTTVSASKMFRPTSFSFMDSVSLGLNYGGIHNHKNTVNVGLLWYIPKIKTAGYPIEFGLNTIQQEAIELQSSITHKKHPVSLRATYSAYGEISPYEAFDYPMLRGIRRMGLMYTPFTWFSIEYAHLYNSTNQFTFSFDYKRKGIFSQLGTDISLMQRDKKVFFSTSIRAGLFGGY